VAGFVPTSGQTPEQDAQQLTTAFLTAWQSGGIAQAAKYTDHPAQAQAALASYGKDLGLRKLTLTTNSAIASTTRNPAASASGSASASASASAPVESVTFLITDVVSAPVSGQTLTGTWSYHSKLVAYEVPGTPGWFINWQPSVMAPNLTATEHLATLPVGAKVQSVTDDQGRDLTTYKDAGLNNIDRLLTKQAPPGQGGTPGLDVQVVNGQGVAVPNLQAQVVAPGDIPSLATTIDATAESAARSAVAMHNDSSAVVIQASTGHILAIANNAQFNDFALTAKVAPGSTMKIITSTSLFNSGTLTPSTPVACPVTYQIQGITYHNDQGESEPAGTPFETDFAQSCNNAFTTQWPHLSNGYSLAETAQKYYGLDQKWNIGIPGVSTSYFNAPADASGSELAQEAWGEGSLTACPLAMASVGATVSTGTFKQPVLLPSAAQQVTATPLPAATDNSLKTVMRAVVTSGTAAGVGFGPNVYGKTGTADIQGQQQPNSWMVAFDPSKNVAVASLVLNAGYGAKYAGPEAAAILNAL